MSTSSSKSTNSSITDGPVSPDVTLLRRKIAKVKTMMNAEEEDKKLKKLSIKLNQYETALAEYENGEGEGPTPLSPVRSFSPPGSPSSISTGIKKKVITTKKNTSKAAGEGGDELAPRSPRKTPRADQKRKSKSVSIESTIPEDRPSTSKQRPKSKSFEVSSPRQKKKSTSISSSSKGSSKQSKEEEVTPFLLQRKLKKVEKMIQSMEDDGKDTNSKEYIKLTKKREEYKLSLKKFEAKIISQFLKGKNVLKSQPLVGINSKPKKNPSSSSTTEKPPSPKKTKKKTVKSPKSPSSDKKSLTKTTKSTTSTKDSTKKDKEKEEAPSTDGSSSGTSRPPRASRADVEAVTGSGGRKTQRPRTASRKKSKTFRVSATRILELDKEFKPTKYPKSKEDEQIILSLLKKHFVFKKLNAASKDELLQAFEPTREYNKGEVIVEQDDDPELPYFYIIGSGDSMVDYEVNGVVVGNDKTGGAFGENSLLYNSPRKATVRAAVDNTRLFQLDQITFRYILQNQVKFKTVWRQSVKKIMAMNRLLGTVGTPIATLPEDDESESESEALKGGESKKEEDVTRQVDKAIVDKDILSPSSERTKSLCLSDLTKKVEGDGAGGPSKLKKQGSLELDDLGLDDEDTDFDDDETWLSEMSKSRMSLSSSFHSTVMCVDDLNRDSILGEGQFGEVWKVNPLQMDGMDEVDFALKIQAKEDMMRETMNVNTITVAEAIDRECNILAQLVHPFIVEFVHRFEDETNIYLVMGIIKGVELWNVIHREINDEGDYESGFGATKEGEAQAKFYGVVIADTLRYIHRQKICYRDMKPENVMIDHTGYPVIVDFGFAKEIPDGKTFTFCGTPQYTCPEIIANLGHGYAVVSRMV